MGSTTASGIILCWNNYTHPYVRDKTKTLVTFFTLCFDFIVALLLDIEFVGNRRAIIFLLILEIFIFDHLYYTPLYFLVHLHVHVHVQQYI